MVTVLLEFLVTVLLEYINIDIFHLNLEICGKTIKLTLYDGVLVTHLDIIYHFFSLHKTNNIIL